MAGEGDLSWPKGRAKSRGKSWTQRLDNSFIVMILPVHPARVFLAHGRKGVGMQKRLKIGVSLPIPPRRASVCLSACLPAGLLRDLEEGSRSSLLPTTSGSAFVCLAALRGQEEAAGPGNNGSFSGSPRLPRSDRGHGTVARRQAQPPSANAMGAHPTRRRWGPPVGCGTHTHTPSLAHPSSLDPKPGSRAWVERGRGTVSRGCALRRR